MHKLEEYINVGTKRMRCGYTTGTCAAAAARAAAELLLTGQVVPAVTVQTPAGIEVLVEVEEHDSGAGWAQCAVQKDSGDDPDVTNGAFVYARVEVSAEPGIRIDGGVGVGRVTREGLDQPVGAAAINSTPRRMIEEQVAGAIADAGESRLQALASALGEAGDAAATGADGAEANAAGDAGDGAAGATAAEGATRPATSAGHGAASAADDNAAAAADASSIDGATAASSPGLLVTISIPAGVELAAKTFNPRLGIEGGISVLGTGGIVRPMSEDALISSIELEMRMLYERGVRDLLVVPGNYGRDFALGQLQLNMDEAVSCSNYFGATLDAACVLGFNRVLIVGHIGKMSKVAGGIMNTHSRVADCRVEVLAAHAALAGAPQEVVAAIMGAATTDAALDVLKEHQLDRATMTSLMRNLADKLAHRVGGALQVEAIVFSNVHGVLGKTPGAEELARLWTQEG